MLDKIEKAASYLKSRYPLKPEVCIILGTGLGSLVNELKPEFEISYEEIPGFPLSTVETHSGMLYYGKFEGKNVIILQGRFHYYEGYNMKEITFPVRVMKELGINKLFLSNACGSLRDEYKKGSLMIINDHINLQTENPLRGKNDDSLGPRFPDMSNPYDTELLNIAIEKKLDIPVHQGVYVSVPGPNLETKAEYRYLKIIGGDVVGMSTVPEVIVANHANIRVFAVGVITDEGFHANLKPISIPEIIEVAKKAEPHMTALMKHIISSC